MPLCVEAGGRLSEPFLKPINYGAYLSKIGASRVHHLRSSCGPFTGNSSVGLLMVCACGVTELCLKVVVAEAL